jgi:hypothetical protein
MMQHVKEVGIDDWAGFDAEVTRILEAFERSRGGGKGYISAPLFRGQADLRWPLVTTLERFSTQSWSVKSYYRLMLSVAPAINSLTPRAWPLDRDLAVDEGDQGPPPGYEFMIYLRHHGFPSPLLDWTRSPYVAAFFAFAPQQSTSEAVAVYAFLEHVGHGKAWSGDGARIIGLGPYAVTHERHYAQQCEYTICKKRLGGNFLYCNHYEALHHREGAQDLLTKYVIPVAERGRFLHKLESMNIHAYSLFRDEAALMQTLAYREIEKQVDL